MKFEISMAKREVQSPAELATLCFARTGLRLAGMLLAGFMMSLLYSLSAIAQVETRGNQAMEYFLNASPRSIDEMMEGCFKNPSCAEAAKELVDSFAGSSLDRERHQSTLGNCLAHQQAMNICANFLRHVIDVALAVELSKLKARSAKTFQSGIDAAHASKAKQINKFCTDRVVKEVGVGYAAAGVEFGCIAEEKRKLALELRKIERCDTNLAMCTLKTK